MRFARARSSCATPAQTLSAWMQKLERAGCEVRREGPGHLSVLLPGPGSAWLGTPAGAPGWDRWFWDRIAVSVSPEGEAKLRWIYPTRAQLAIHAAAVALVLAARVLEPGPAEPAHLLGLLGLSQLVPFAVSALSVWLAIRDVGGAEG